MYIHGAVGGGRGAGGKCISNVVPYMWKVLSHGVQHHYGEKIVFLQDTYGIYMPNKLSQLGAHCGEVFKLAISDHQGLLNEQDLRNWTNLLMTCFEHVPSEVSVCVCTEEFVLFWGETCAQCSDNAKVVEIPMASTDGVQGWIWAHDEA